MLARLPSRLRRGSSCADPPPFPAGDRWASRDVGTTTGHPHPGPLPKGEGAGRTSGRSYDPRFSTLFHRFRPFPTVSLPFHGFPRFSAFSFVARFDHGQRPSLANLNGNLIQKTDRNERATEYSYDALNRMCEERWMDGASVVRTISYSYDFVSELTHVADPDAEHDYPYDEFGRVTLNKSNGSANRRFFHA